MSGIVALVGGAAALGVENALSQPNPQQSRGAAVFETLLQSLAFRGPDGQNSFAGDSAWLGHALLRTDAPPSEPSQPCSLDGITWITADARLDGRDELVCSLGSPTGLRHRELLESSDAQLILHAYRVWGRRCAEHLTGDFTFALWDGRRRALLCARDQLGIKPLYYAKLASGLAVSNTLQTLLHLPEVSGELNETAIGDFLLFGCNQSCETTVFCDIQRVPAAHALWWQGETFHVSRYFDLIENSSAHAPLRFRKSEECVEEFCLRFQQAVGDRLRSGRASLLMSGGLDSTSVAATAVGALAASSQIANLKAFTATYRKTCGDREGEFATLAASAMGIPIQLVSGDGYALFERADDLAAARPEPADEFLGAFDDDFHRAAAVHSRVALAGEGGDIGLHPQAGPYLLGLLRRLQLFRAVTGITSSLWLCHQLPPLLLGLRGRGQNRAAPEFPQWLNPDFARRNDLAERWRKFSRPSRTPPGHHPFRPAACAALQGNFWPSLFESADSGATGILMETRYPFFDVRLLSWLLALPPAPWCVDKYLLRQAMRGRLPETVRLRPKAPLPLNPAALRLGHTSPSWLAFTGQLAQYVSAAQLSPIDPQGDQDAIFMKFRAVSLNLWLQNSRHLKYKKALGGIP
jgi:asparagine synthase (glutamine-hydrolysing)